MAEPSIFGRSNGPEAPRQPSRPIAIARLSPDRASLWDGPAEGHGPPPGERPRARAGRIAVSRVRTVAAPVASDRAAPSWLSHTPLVESDSSLVNSNRAR